MKNSILTIFFVFVGTLTQMSAQNFTDETINNLNNAFTSYIEANEAFKVGVSAAVYVENTGFWASTYGRTSINDVQPQTLTTDTLFQAYSITKTFTSALILQLMAEGKLTLDNKIYEILNLESYTNIDSTATVRHLLSHRSGFAEYGTNLAFQNAILANPALVWQIQDVLAYVPQPLFAVGEGMAYSNTNYLLLGLIAESVSDSTVTQLFRARFFAPLALNHTCFPPFEPYPYNVANPHDILSGTQILDFQLMPFAAVSSTAWTAGAIASTPTDLVRWANLLYTKNAISTEARDTLLNSINWVGSYGYGIERKNEIAEGAFGHNGGAFGYMSALIHFPENATSISVCVNQGITCFNPFIMNMLVKELYQTVHNIQAVNDTRTDIFSVYPNPATNKIFVKTNSLNINAIDVYDISGKKQLSLQFGNTTYSTEIETTNLKSGIYILCVKSENKYFYKKVAVK